MITAYAAKQPKSQLGPFTYNSKLEEHDVLITISHCGICHSDVHIVDGDWGDNFFPVVPGHEIVGAVAEVGPGVKSVRKGDRVAVGWQCGSCLDCEYCAAGQENLCGKSAATCMGHFGGFADQVTAHERFVFKLPEHLESASTAPLLCGGITVYSPLNRYAKSGMTVGIIGIGGLGHMALLFAKAMGCKVYAIYSSLDKEAEVKKFGVVKLLNAKSPEALKSMTGSFDFLLSTIPASVDFNVYLPLLKKNGVFCQVGAAPGTLEIPASPLVVDQKTVCGSVIGSPKQIKEMLTFAAEHNIKPMIELVPMKDCNIALDRTRKGKARYRMVLEN